jgi:hypothetical protein
MEIIDRLKAPTPDWWKKAQMIAGGASLIAVTILSGGIALPATFATVLTWVSVIGGTVVATAQLTKDKKPISNTDLMHLLQRVKEGEINVEDILKDYLLTDEQVKFIK